MSTSTRTVASELVQALASLGVTTAFGVPGVQTLELYRALGASGIRAVTPTHEQSAGFMACGFAQASGGLGVCIVIGGPGVTNLATPLAQAFREGIPLLVLSAATSTVEQSRGRGALHGLPRLTGVTSSIAVLSEEIASPGALEALLPRAVAALARGPVHLAVPVDVFRAPAPRLARIERGRPEPASSSVLAGARDVLAAARRPVVLVGPRARSIGREATRLAAAIGAVVVHEGGAHGILDPEEALNLGSVSASALLLDELAAADVVVAIGADLADAEAAAHGAMLPTGEALVRIDDRPDPLPGATPLAAEAIGDVAATLRELVAGLPGRRRPVGEARAAALRARIDPAPDDVAMAPWLDAIAAAPGEPALCLDLTQPAYSAVRMLRLAPGRTIAAPFAFGTLGTALPTAIGVSIASGRPAIALAGDGGALYTITELATARRAGASVAFVVWNNGSYAEPRNAMEADGMIPIGCDIGGVDFVGLGRSLGVHAVRVDTPEGLARELGAAMRTRAPTLIEVLAPSRPASQREEAR